MKRKAVEVVRTFRPQPVTPKTLIRKLPLRQAVQHLRTHYSSVEFPPSIKSVNVTFDDSRTFGGRLNGLAWFLQRFGPGLAYANPVKFQATKTGQHISPGHARKLRDAARLEQETKEAEELAKAKADAEAREGLEEEEPRRSEEAMASVAESVEESGEGTEEVTAEKSGMELVELNSLVESMQQGSEQTGITIEYANSTQQPDQLIYISQSPEDVFRELCLATGIPIPTELRYESEMGDEEIPVEEIEAPVLQIESPEGGDRSAEQGKEQMATPA